MVSGRLVTRSTDYLDSQLVGLLVELLNWLPCQLIRWQATKESCNAALKSVLYSWQAFHSVATEARTKLSRARPRTQRRAPGGPAYPAEGWGHALRA